MPIWPGRGGSDPEGKYSDVAQGRQRGGGARKGGGANQRLVQEILERDGPQPTPELARKFHEERYVGGSPRPYDRRAKRSARTAVSNALNSLADQGVVDRGSNMDPKDPTVAWWRIRPQGFEVHEDSARGRSTERKHPQHPIVTGDPSTWGEAAKARRKARNVEKTRREREEERRRTDPTNPENMGENRPEKRGGRKDDGGGGGGVRYKRRGDDPKDDPGGGGGVSWRRGPDKPKDDGGGGGGVSYKPKDAPKNDPPPEKGSRWQDYL